MKMIILAAGEGTRLRPYTADRPKCMVPLAGRPLLHWQLATAHAGGLADSIIVVGGYRADRLDAPGATILHNPDFARTNMVATLMCARDHIIPGQDLIIGYGDIIYEPRVLQSLLASEGPISLTADQQWYRFWSARMADPLADAETFKLRSDGTVAEIGKKPTRREDIQAQYMGLIRISGEAIKGVLQHYDALDRNRLYDGKDFPNMYMTSFLQSLIDAGWPIHACLVDNGWLEVDTAEELQHFNRLYETGGLGTFCDLAKIPGDRLMPTRHDD